MTAGVYSEAVVDSGGGCDIDGAGCKGAGVTMLATGGGAGIKPSALGPSNPDDMECLAVPESSLENDPGVEVDGEAAVRATVCMFEEEEVGEGGEVADMLFRG
ncbi:hypothetical protein EC991_001730 [Linnemannia zychae]|nr:hypothetical protein EC991_001730 [Linnemannia zychae]